MTAPLPPPARWVLVAVALASALGAGAVTLAHGGRDVPVQRPVAATPSVVPSPTTSAAPSPTRPVPSPPPGTAAPHRAAPATEVLPPAARPDLDVLSVLGPPPGPRDDPRPARTAAPAQRFALLVGVQDYRSPTVDTIGSVRDVQQIRAQLLAAGWLPQNVRTVTDGAATGAALRDGLAWLSARNRAGTFALFHYSGHVKMLGGGTEALWPVDRDLVRDRELAAILSRGEGRLWVDVAGCEAAGFLPGLPDDRVLFSGSSKSTEKSYEFPPWRMSVWTGLLFDRGLGQGKADADGDGRTTVGEALRSAQYQAQAVTLGQSPHGRQTPQFAGAPDLGWTLADPPA